jgi:hypothetical protein
VGAGLDAAGAGDVGLGFAADDGVDGVVATTLEVAEAGVSEGSVRVGAGVFGTTLTVEVAAGGKTGRTVVVVAKKLTKRRSKKAATIEKIDTRIPVRYPRFV